MSAAFWFASGFVSAVALGVLVVWYLTCLCMEDTGYNAEADALPEHEYDEVRQ